MTNYFEDFEGSDLPWFRDPNAPKPAPIIVAVVTSSREPEPVADDNRRVLPTP